MDKEVAHIVDIVHWWPKDSSSTFYQRWIIALVAEIDRLEQELLECGQRPPDHPPQGPADSATEKQP